MIFTQKIIEDEEKITVSCTNKFFRVKQVLRIGIGKEESCQTVTFHFL